MDTLSQIATLSGNLHRERVEALYVLWLISHADPDRDVYRKDIGEHQTVKYLIHEGWAEWGSGHPRDDIIHITHEGVKAAEAYEKEYGLNVAMAEDEEDAEYLRLLAQALHGEGLKVLSAPRVRVDWARVAKDPAGDEEQPGVNRLVSDPPHEEGHKPWPWEQIPPQGDDRQIVKDWWQGYTAKEIAERLGRGRTAKTITNKITILRKQFGPGVVPYHKDRPAAWERVRKLG